MLQVDFYKDNFYYTIFKLFQVHQVSITKHHVAIYIAQNIIMQLLTMLLCTVKPVLTSTSEQRPPVYNSLSPNFPKFYSNKL
jgi:hypothetical protein